MAANTTRIFLDLLRAAEHLAGRRDREDLFRDLSLAVRAALGATAVMLYAVRPSVGGSSLVPVGWCVAGMESGEWQDSALVGDLPADPFLASAVIAKTPWYREHGAEMERIAFPVSNGSRVSWLLEVQIARSPGVHVLQGLVALVRTFEHLMVQWEYANLDTLTGLLNRKTFDEQFDRLLALAERNRERARKSERRQQESKHPCWLGIVDIDHFKHINDSRGHLFGDEVLILLAKCMREHFRADDTLFRFGGEEFVVMLRHAPEQTVARVFERFRSAVEHYEFPQVGQVTCSVGFCRVDDRRSPAELLGRADEALYFAKDHGRNQVRNYEQLVSTGQLKPTAASSAQEDADRFF